MPPRPSRNAIGDLFNQHPELFVFTGATPDNFYTAHVANTRNVKQTVRAAYSQLDVRVTSQLSLRAGLRVEETLNRFREFDPRLRAEVIRAGFPVNASGRAYLTHTTLPRVGSVIRLCVGGTLTGESHVRDAWVLIQSLIVQSPSGQTPIGQTPIG